MQTTSESDISVRGRRVPICTFRVTFSPIPTVFVPPVDVRFKVKAHSLLYLLILRGWATNLASVREIGL
ncbi:hypothetical protein ABIB27_002210 [Arthrobacter sp. UYEF21]